MKRNLFNLCLSIATITVLMSSCKNAEVTPDNVLEGTYKEIVNPILCALPTMRDVIIKSDGASYKMTFTNTNTTLKEDLKNMMVEKNDSTTKLFIDGREIGKFTNMKYTDFSNDDVQTKEGFVLMLRFDKQNKHYEFMGRK